jgi:hypothetical protein
MLEHECAQLAEELQDKRRNILLEELNCFNEIIGLHKHVLNNDQSPDRREA